MDRPSEKAAKQTADALEKSVAEVDTPSEAADVLDRLDASTGNLTEGDIREPGREHGPREMAGAIQREQVRRPEDPAAVIREAGEQVAAASEAARVAADKAVGSLHEETQNPDVVRGRELLKRELMSRLKPLQAVDTAIFVSVNQLPHPPLADRALGDFSRFMTGGHAWVLVPLIGLFGDRPRALRTLLIVMPALWATTAVVEYPVKHFFRRRRPFISIVRSIVVGRKPGSYSFPSGHSAAAFGGAALLSVQYPRQAKLFFALAGLVGFSRVYLGAHYPGDVLSGGMLGVTLSGFFGQILKRLFLGSHSKARRSRRGLMPNE